MLKPNTKNENYWTQFEKQIAALQSNYIIVTASSPLYVLEKHKTYSKIVWRKCMKTWKLQKQLTYD